MAKKHGGDPATCEACKHVYRQQKALRQYQETEASLLKAYKSNKTTKMLRDQLEKADKVCRALQDKAAKHRKKLYDGPQKKAWRKYLKINNG